MDDSFGRYEAVGRGVGLHYLELHCSHPASHYEGVSLVDGSVRLQEVRLNIHLGTISVKNTAKLTRYTTQNIMSNFSFQRICCFLLLIRESTRTMTEVGTIYLEPVPVACETLNAVIDWED